MIRVIIRQKQSIWLRMVMFLLMSSLFLAQVPLSYAGISQDENCTACAATLAPRLNVSQSQLQLLFSTPGNPASQMLFTFPEAQEGNEPLIRELAQLNELNKREGVSAVIARILENPQVTEKIAGLIRSQDRMDDTGDYSIDRGLAEAFKFESLKRAVDNLKGRDIFFFQVEYELSMAFLEGFKAHLVNRYGATEQEAVYATGQLAKLMMAGGLGSFKPDLVRGFYNVLKKFWGPIEARNRLHVMGVLYAESIKGEGRLQEDGNLATVVQKIQQSKSENGQKGTLISPEAHELVEVALESLDYVATYKDIEVNIGGIGKVDVTVFRNPFSELHEYWMYCPQVFGEAYPGFAADEQRTVQAFVYREVFLRHIKHLYDEKMIGKKLVISTSETSTALANPLVVDRDLQKYPPEQRDEYRKIFDFLAEADILLHHYNHTIVPAGMGKPLVDDFGDLKVAPEFRFVLQGAENDGERQAVDLRLLTAVTNAIITGCSTAHTEICREHPDLYQIVEKKVVEDSLFGNSEGSDIERWQGKQIIKVITYYMEKTGARTYAELFPLLYKDKQLKESFSAAIYQAKKIQKQKFIAELFKGTFGQLEVTKEELERAGIDLMQRPFFTFVRRFVSYKCGDLIVDILYDPGFRERIVKTGAVIFIGGRKFDDFAEEQHQRIRELIKQDPRMKAHIFFLSNHNVATSWLIQQGTDFGGMLSWEGMEAGPTSPSNAGLNWTNLFTVWDGVMQERVKEVVEDEEGNINRGTGYIIKYGKNLAQDGQSRIPDKNSFVTEMETATQRYDAHSPYQAIAFNNLWLNMTQGDIRTQASGLIRQWSEELNRQAQRDAQIKAAIELFVQVQTKESINSILYTAPEGINSFDFNGGSQIVAENAGLAGFFKALKLNNAQGYIYSQVSDFVNYTKSLLGRVRNTEALIALLEQVAQSPLTAYEKQKESIYIFELLVQALIDMKDIAPSVLDAGLNLAGHALPGEASRIVEYAI